MTYLEWDYIGGVSGQGGIGSIEKTEDGRPGAIRIAIPAFFHCIDQDAPQIPDFLSNIMKNNKS